MDDERLQRITAADYLADLAHADAVEIRALRDECQACEQRLSYVRRVLQGHLDLALAEVARRRGDGAPAFVAHLAQALTGPAGGARSPRAVGLYEPIDTDDSGLDVDTARLPDMDDPALDALIERLQERERAVSAQRGILLDHLDRLQDALVARYRDDRAAIDDVASTLGRS